jgi:hypothetical protein
MLQELTHFPEVLKVGFAGALDVADVPAPDWFPVLLAFQPDSCNERL